MWKIQCRPDHSGRHLTFPTPVTWGMKTDGTSKLVTVTHGPTGYIRPPIRTIEPAAGVRLAGRPESLEICEDSRSHCSQAQKPPLTERVHFAPTGYAAKVTYSLPLDKKSFQKLSRIMGRAH